MSTYVEDKQAKIDEVEDVVERANQQLEKCLANESELRIALSEAEESTRKAERHVNEADALLSQLKSDGVHVPGFGEWPKYE